MNLDKLTWFLLNDNQQIIWFSINVDVTQVRPDGGGLDEEVERTQLKKLPPLLNEVQASWAKTANTSNELES